MHLLHVLPGHAHHDENDDLVIDPKTTEGLREYARTWTGQITVVVASGYVNGSETRTRTWCTGEPFDVLESSDVLGTISDLRPDVVGALHRSDAALLLDLGVPVVLTTEFTRAIRTDQQLITSTSPLDRVRVRLGQLRNERTYRQSAQRAAGLQCNGPAAWNAYAGLNRRPIAFHDHRIRRSDIEATKVVKPWDGSGPLRIAFSGRLTAVKGPQHVLSVARELAQIGAPVRVSFLGDGDMRTALEREAPGNVEFLGSVDFDETWKDYVRNDVDLMVLPHPQGDPSCTYFEALGSGAPVLGFQNTTFGPLAVREGVGWAVPVGDTGSLTRKVLDILDHPDQLEEARAAGIAFMEERPYEAIAKKRADHFRSCAEA